MDYLKIAVIGNGGREHALCWKLSQSSSVSHVYAIPGNGGTEREKKVTNIETDIQNFEWIVEICTNFQIDLVVIGPELPLANGMANYLLECGIPCFGPTAKAARIEADKAWSKFFMDKYEIPTAKWQSFTNAQEAKNFILNSPYSATVVKASGLAAGKGVIVATNKNEACKAVDDIMTSHKLGKAADIIVIEEYLEGEEVSVLAFTDGKTIKTMLPVQDHKRLLNYDQGPNTGGMGAYCPYLLTNDEMNFIQKHILQKAVDGLMKENTPFVGVLYAGLMITSNGIKVLEFNCRFGDPETQVLLPMLETDLVKILFACCNGSLNQCDIIWKDNQCCVSVVMASEGYPDTPSVGQPILGLYDWDEVPNIHIFHASTIMINDDIVTNGGRVLNVIAVDQTLQGASIMATNVCSQIKFDGCQYRTDIAHKGILKSILMQGGGSYLSAGVDISSGNKLIDEIKPLVEGTFKHKKISPLGSFGAVIDARLKEYNHPLLVSGCDGVGTKLKIAQDCNKHETIGQDLVAMCINDILAHGAKPLFFLDYFACGKLKTTTAKEVIKGIVAGCKLADCALVGGETAEMPGFYTNNEYDLAGFAVGVVDKCKLLPSSDIENGDLLIYLPSSGVHSNGFSLIRKIMKDSHLSYNTEAPFSREKRSFGEEFLTPTKIYVRDILPLVRASKIKAFAHITGGGLLENVIRVIPPSLKVTLNASRWSIPRIFAWIATAGNINEQEMLRTFNCGVGGVVVVSPQYKEEVCKVLQSNDIGVLEVRQPRESQINIINFSQNISKLMVPFVPPLLQIGLNQSRKRVAVLISGTGTNLQALIESTRESDSEVQIVLVISSRETAIGLHIAQHYQIPNLILRREQNVAPNVNDEAVHDALIENSVELVCLAGYMHILSKWFCKQWRGKMLNIHPSLLPAFKGLHAQKQALEAGVKISGCTVHFVEPEVDAGPIIEQAAVPVYPTDDVNKLTDRIKTQEHKTFPKALNLVASGKVSLDLETGKINWN